MNKKDEIKIELMSNIDDQIIERQTLKRFRLMLKNKYNRKKLTGWFCAAACLLVTFSTLFTTIFHISPKQVPVYQGMTISNSIPSSHMVTDRPDASPLSLMFDSKDGTDATSFFQKTSASVLASSVVLNEANNETESDTLEGESAVTGETQLAHPEIEGSDRLLYYAKKNEDIYITIHINNPASFEILSFTLNGNKYQSYMFEEGSNSEALILKVNVGDVQGIVDYTIDAIKYIDGTDIKDVRMDGEKTVQVGVYPENQPTVAITDKAVGYEEIAFTATLTDENDMIQAPEGKLFAFLYEGADQVASRELSTNEKTAVLFPDLVPGTEYRYEIVAYYDSFDGTGFGAYCLYKECFYTKSLVEIVNTQLAPDGTISFDINKIGEDVSIQKIELLNQIDTVEFTGDGETRSLAGLAIGIYTVKATYSYGNKETKIGYAYSTNIAVESLGSITKIVKNGRITRYYDESLMQFNPTTQDWRVHLGVDISPTNEHDVYAAFRGIVKQASEGRVVITDQTGTVELIYENIVNVLVEEGSVVTVDQKIGTIGNTYMLESADEAHVHIELKVLGEKKDPMDYFTN